MSEAIFNTDPIIVVDEKKLEHLKYQASIAPRKRFRLCLHHTTNALVNEMIIAFCRETYNRPHRHPADKTESYHIISGLMKVFIFDDYGHVIKRIQLGDRDSGHPFLLHMEGGIWHMPFPESEYVVTHETFTGPFQRDVDVEFASWSPEEEEKLEVQAFLNRVINK
jgi:glucose-6-phosphate isomerase